MLRGEEGEALKFAMQVVVRAARVMRAPHLIDASFAHIDACHYNGRAHLDFANFLVKQGATFKLPAWTNTIPVSLVQEEVRVDANQYTLQEARDLAHRYVQLGCKPVWTCAPYQLPGGPGLGDQIIGSESNAVAYYNSVVGARTNKYGDFLDVCAGLTARVPFAGLHTDQGRRGELVFDVTSLPEAMRETNVFCHVLGYLLGKMSDSRIPVVLGLPAHTHADNLKAISAAGAASGGVGMFHAVGVTPEAPDLETALQGCAADDTIIVDMDRLNKARASLSQVAEGPLNMVALGTPHFSYSEFERLVALLDGCRVHPTVTLYVSTSRYVAALIEEKGWMDSLRTAGAEILVDTCTYFSPAVKACKGRVMTNSAKWAYYAPGMLPVEVAFGSLEDCVHSAIAGEVMGKSAAWPTGSEG